MKLLPGTSHTDHGLTADQLAFVLETFADRDSFFIETVELPESLGTLPCGLHGPLMGDGPVAEAEVHYAKRGDRLWASRLVKRESRPTRKLSVIAGPHDDESCVLYTAFGGPVTPREPFDAPDAEREESLKVWNEHALSA